MTDRKTMSEAELNRLEAGGATIKRKQLTRKKRNLPRTTVDMDHDHGVLENGRTTRDKGHDHELLSNGRTSVENDHDHKWAPKRVQTSPKEVPHASMQASMEHYDVQAEATRVALERTTSTMESVGESMRAALEKEDTRPRHWHIEVERDEPVDGVYKPFTGLDLRAVE